MKNVIITSIIIIVFSLQLYAQVYEHSAQQMFLFTQPNARSEAMGRGNAALTGNPFFIFYNPANSSFLEGISAQVTHLDFNYPYQSASSDYNTYSAGVNLAKYGSFSFNYLHFVFGGIAGRPDEVLQNSMPDNADVNIHPSTNMYMLNYSYPLQEGLSIGVNINYFEDKDVFVYSKGWMLDAGLLKKFSAASSFGRHNVFIALSFNNLSNTAFEDRLRGKWYLPSIMHLGSVYGLETAAKLSDFRLFKVLLSAEYFDLLNSKDHTQYKFGIEVSILEMLKLRGGWYTEKLPDFGYADTWDIESLGEYTYGFGVELVLRKIIKAEIPVTLKFDYTSLLLPLYFTGQGSRKHSPVYSLSMDYVL